MSTPVIFVIGYGPGISAGIASLFGSKGFSVGLISRSEEKLALASAELAKSNIKVATAVGDVTSMDSIHRALGELENALGAPNVLVSNAASNGPPGSALGPTPLQEITPQVYEQHLRISAIGAFIVGQWAVQHLKVHNGKKMLFFTGGGLSLNPTAAHAGLASSKAAMRALSKSFYEDEKPKGTHVATVTVVGRVKDEDPKWNAKSIAELYWTLYQEKDNWTWEVVY